MIPKFAIDNRITICFCVALIAIGGIWSYYSMGRLEDPEFTIKTAVVVTLYPGASASEVQERVTTVVERYIRKVKNVDKIRSVSRPGQSIIYVDMLPSIPPDRLPQAWDELRNKMSQAKAEIPLEALTPIVRDDFGDVFGILLALTGDGISDAELHQRAKELQNRLYCVDQVGRIELWGVRKECIEIEMSRTRMAELQIHPAMIMFALGRQNLKFDTGQMTLQDSVNIRIALSGEFSSVKEIENLAIPNGQAGLFLQHIVPAITDQMPSEGLTGSINQLTRSNALSGEPIRLGDIATVRQTAIDPPLQMMRSNGDSAILIGVAPISGGDVIKMGKAVREKINEIIPTFTGCKIDAVCYQPDNVKLAINTFERNLIEAVIIVTLVVMLTMGLRSGLLITSSLLVVMLATFCVLWPMGVVLQRTSLGSFIVALGILVDDAVVVGDMILVMMQRGIPRKQACIEGARKVGNQLLGATIVGALAFLPVYLSPDDTGEYTRDLFIVLAISLMISWFVAMMQTPVVYSLFVHVKANANATGSVHNGPIYRMYRQLLHWALHHKTVTLLAMFVAMVMAGYACTHVKQIFFPAAQRSQLMVHLRLPQGTSIKATDACVKQIEAHLKTLDGVTQISSFIGGGPLRFYLPYEPEMPDSNYAYILINVSDIKRVDQLIKPLDEWLDTQFPETQVAPFPGAQTKVSKFSLGPTTHSDIEIRFSGPDGKILRQLAEQAEHILREQPLATDFEIDWRQQIFAWSPDYSHSKGVQTMISRADVNTALRWATQGIPTATYNDGDKVLPIILRGASEERNDINNITNIPIWGLAFESVPLAQVISGKHIEFQEAELWRRNGTPAITVGCSPRYGCEWNELFPKVRSNIEAIKLPTGYSMEWGGQYDKSTQAQTTLLSKLPIALILMAVVVVLLFNGLRQPLIILLTFPLALIGVTIGLVVMDMPFGFMALVGIMSLLGMIVRNGVVLMTQIDVELAKGGSPYDAIIDAAVERIRPVTVAAMTVVFGMIPLLRDPLFNSMAAAIMFGLIFATILTLVIVPVLYMIFFRVKIPENYDTE